MKKRSNYNTKQKDEILSIIKNKNKEFTVKELYEDLDGLVGLTTIYRLVDSLVKNKNINKYIGNDNITYYEYLEECNQDNHFYLKCDKCGTLVHIDCDCIKDITDHILSNHNFKPNKEHIIFSGLCASCSK